MFRSGVIDQAPFLLDALLYCLASCVSHCLQALVYSF